MSDHWDAPGMKSPNMGPRVDICDIFAFQKPKDVNKSVFVLNVNPVAPKYADSFASEAVYELKVDTNADAIADIAYRFTFSAKEDNGVQKVTVLRASGQQAKGNGNDGEVIKLGSHNIVTWLAFHYCRIKLEQSFELDQKVAKGSEEIELI